MADAVLTKELVGSLGEFLVMRLKLFTRVRHLPLKLGSRGLVQLAGVINGLDVLRLANLRPRVSDVQRSASVDGSRVRLGQVAQHEAVKHLAVEGLGRSRRINLPSEKLDLLDKLRTEVRPLGLVELLQLALVLDGSLQRHAVSVREEGKQHTTNAVLHFDPLRESLHRSQGAFKVLLRGEGVAVLVHQQEREVTYHPQEVREEVGKLRAGLRLTAGFSVRLGSDVLRQLDNEREVVERRLVDGSDGVVDEVGRQQQGERKDLRIMVGIGVKRSDAFGIDYEQLYFTAIRQLRHERFVPEPQAFGA
mmetsp:Transcript_5754/g.20299  ORF Transcript_5754/g.20299 Transcript_5754/m.20299 type:complete len:306 (-) Transcript_5754:348-1265(-)